MHSSFTVTGEKDNICCVSIGRKYIISRMGHNVDSPLSIGGHVNKQVKLIGIFSTAKYDMDVLFGILPRAWKVSFLMVLILQLRLKE